MLPIDISKTEALISATFALKNPWLEFVLLCKEDGKLSFVYPYGIGFPPDYEKYDYELALISARALH